MNAAHHGLPCAAPPAPHGGTDDGPPVAFDFSTNANPYGPPPGLWRAVRRAPRHAYPEPGYRALRETLGAALAVDPARIEPAAGGTEAIRRLTLAARLHGVGEAWVPWPAFGEYAAAAEALGLRVHAYALSEGARPRRAALVWACDPGSPDGRGLDASDWARLGEACEASGSVLAVDRAYAPLRLEGRDLLPSGLAAGAWLLHCPNKVLGLTGVRAACLVAPSRPGRAGLAAAVRRCAPAWVLSAEGLALLAHWHAPESARHVEDARCRLRIDRAALRVVLSDLGWTQDDSATPFWLARPPEGRDVPTLLAGLRKHGVKLRDAASFGLPGRVRIAAQPPRALAGLVDALHRLPPATHPSGSTLLPSTAP